MSETVTRWEGRTVNGKYPLRRYLGGSDHSAVFLTLRDGAVDSDKAAVKLIPADIDAKGYLSRWGAARELSHPNLIHILDAGRDGASLLYVLEEFAEENLSQVVPERALTLDEADVTILPVLQALQFVHGKGFVHGRIQPTNILAIDDRVKLSCDSLTTLGECGRSTVKLSAYDPPEASAGELCAASDVWQLGITLIEVLTQRLPVWDRVRRQPPEIPAEVPEPYREIARHCLQINPRSRWTITQIVSHLERDWASEERLRA